MASPCDCGDGDDMQCDIGVVGLGVMGSNLALTWSATASAWPATTSTRPRRRRSSRGPAAGKNVELATSPDELMAMLQKPRRVLMMVPAGAAGRQRDRAPRRRTSSRATSSSTAATRSSSTPSGAAATSRPKGFNYIGTGVSGGEEGALWGPGIMPGGQVGGVGGAGADLPRDRRQGRRWRAVRGLHGPARRRPLREDGAQRDRVRRHAADRRDATTCCTAASACRPPELHEVFAEWNTRRAEVVPDRDHRRDLREGGRRDRPAAGRRDPRRGRSRRAPASGPARTRSTSARRSRRSTPRSRAASSRRSSRSAWRPARCCAARRRRTPATAQRADRRRARRALRQQDHLVRPGPRPAAARLRRVQVRPEARRRSRGSGGPAASSARRCSATSWRPTSATRPWSNLLLDEAFRDAVESRQARGASSCRRPSASASRCWR